MERLALFAEPVTTAALVGVGVLEWHRPPVEQAAARTEAR